MEDLKTLRKKAGLTQEQLAAEGCEPFFHPVIAALDTPIFLATSASDMPYSRQHI